MGGELPDYDIMDIAIASGLSEVMGLVIPVGPAGSASSSDGAAADPAAPSGALKVRATDIVVARVANLRILHDAAPSGVACQPAK
eukprot:1019477-Pyramimonas_sp.AAC.1